MEQYNKQQNLKYDIKERSNKLIKKSRILKIYKDSQVYVPVIGILGVIIYCFFKSGNYSLNRAVSQYEFYIVLFVVFIYSITIEKSVKELEKEVKSQKETLRNKMILKICNCNNDCECKEEFNAYMKKKGVKII